MMTSLPRVVLLFSLAVLPCFAPAQTSPAKPNVIILKLDDLRSVSPNFKRIADWLKTRNIKSSFGIIANSLEGNNQPYYNWIKQENSGSRSAHSARRSMALMRPRSRC